MTGERGTGVQPTSGAPQAPDPTAQPQLERTNPTTASATTPRRIALAHDWLVGYRGGEAVLEAIARLVARDHHIVGLWTMFHDAAAMRAAIDGADGPVATGAIHPVYVSSLNRLPRAARRWALPMYPMAVRELSRSLAREHARRPIDLLISTSSAAIKGLEPPPGVPHLCYCHTPARYLWSQTDQYAQGRGGALRSLGLRVFGPALRAWDSRTATRVARYIANSSHTAAQIARWYGLPAEVIHPPVRTDYFTPDPGVPRRDFWLYVGALEPYKRVDVAVEAARRSGQRLVVAGVGSQLEHLRASAPPNVEFLGRVTNAKLRVLYRTAGVLLFPQVEDFGIVAAEAQACGLPVVGAAAGGALDSVLCGVTGRLIKDVTPDSLGAAAKACVMDYARAGDACRASAERFSARVFDDKMTAAINAALASRPRR